MYLPPGPDLAWRGNYVSLPAATLKAPVEGNRTVPVEIAWLRDGSSPSYAVVFNAREQRVTPITQISAVHISNIHSAVPIRLLFPDTGFEIELGSNLEGYYPVVTNGLEFIAYTPLTPSGLDGVTIQVLNFLPPPLVFGLSPGGSGVAGVSRIDTTAPLAGGPITATGNISLNVPLAIQYGGTGAITPDHALDALAGVTGSTVGLLARDAAGDWVMQPLAAAGPPALPVSILNGGSGATTGFLALDNLSAAGSQTGVLQRSAGGNWSLSAAGTGTITGVTAGPGLAGGGGTGNVTLGLSIPVSVANGGTGAATLTGVLTGNGTGPLTASLTLPVAQGGTGSGTAAAALTALGAVAKAGDTMTGALTVSQNAAALPAFGATAQFHLGAADGQISYLLMDGFGGATQIRARTSRGTAAARTANTAGDTVWSVVGEATASSNTSALAGQLYLFARDNWSAGANGSAWAFNTVAPGTTTVENPVTIGRGLIVGGGATPLVNDPGPGGLYVGGAVTATGTLAVTPPSGWTVVILNKPTATDANSIVGQRAGVQRWVVKIGSDAAETGSNAGSDFTVERYTDAGGYIGAAMSISRATGNVTMTGALAASGNVSAANYQIGNASDTVAGTFGFPTAGNTGPAVVMWGNGSGGAGLIEFYVGSTVRFSITPAGVATLAAGLLPSVTNALPIGTASQSWSQVNAYAYITTSDAALKEDFAPVPPGALDRVMALSPLTFRWKDGSDQRRHHGFVAGDVRDALGADFGGYAEDKESGLGGIAYNDLTAVLWRAVQELTTRDAALTARIETLENSAAAARRIMGEKR